jgi:lipopolysaccharide/colanic/teichoic acid biosynthesis glycosyltransferase
VGRNKRKFHIYKFRTMVVDAEKRIKEIEHLNEVSGPVFKIKNDPRITPLGRFLRKTSIDELPQLFNVLKGDMSLVGPRPLPVRDYEGFNEDWQRRRFSVRPGITCLWQIAGRSSIPFNRWMELDLEYIDGWSFWLDLQILLRTIPAVLRGSGAA